MHDAATRGRTRRMIDEAVHAPLVAAGFGCQRKRALWLREHGDVVHAVGFTRDSLDDSVSLEWGVWIPELAALFGEIGTPFDGTIAATHVRGGNRRLPNAIKSGESLRTCMAMASKTVRGYLGLFEDLAGTRDIRTYLGRDPQRLSPASNLRRLYIAGLAVLDRTPDATTLVDSAIDTTGLDAAWRPVAARVSAAARGFAG